MSLLLTLGCQDEARNEVRAAAMPAKVDVQGPVVARVDGEPVSLEDVRQTVEATGLSPADALARLEAETLLADYAQRAGYGGSKQDERAIDAARVRALLRVAVERGTAPEDISEADVKARFDVVRSQRERSEGRRFLQVLFRVEQPAQEATAKAAATELLEQIRGLSGDEAQARLGSYPAKSVRDGVTVVREHVADAQKNGTLAAPLEQAVFSVEPPKLVAEVVKTSFGYHVVAVQGTVAAVTLDFSEAQPLIRQTLSLEARTRALDALIAKLKVDRPIRYDEAAIAKGLADDKILGDGM
jgi:peptidyl-prolyl cis-trans isomerase C